MRSPVICFGQQPCGIFPKRFLYAKVATARRLQSEIGGEIVFFYHDSDHDPRETITLLRDRRTGREHRINFSFANKLQRNFSPLFAKRIVPGWQANVARQLPNLVSQPWVDAFKAVQADNVAAFCFEMYRRLGLLDGMRVQRSGAPEFRRRACSIEDYFVDVNYEGELVRARISADALLLHKGGDSYIRLPLEEFEPTQISPTRDTRFRWMQSVVGCTHYVAGASEVKYLETGDVSGVEFVRRDEIAESDRAWVPL